MIQLTRLRSRSWFLNSRHFSRSTWKHKDQERSIPKPQNEKQQKLREEFFRREEEHEHNVNYTLLSPQEKLIHETHNQAVKRYHFTYVDPETGLKVITRLRHFLKGSCCGNAYKFPLRMDPEWKVTQEDLHKYLDVLLVLVKECGDIISDAITNRVNVEIDEKVENVGEGNSSAILTETDLKVEKHLINGLKAKFSDHQFIGEESSGDDKVGRELGNAPTWIIDPIDGTMNFVHSNPLVCTSIGLTVNKKLMIGVVNCPLIGKLYSAVRGEGAYCNGNRIRVSKVSDISKAMIIMELPAGANKDKKSVALSNLEYILENAHAARAPGPAALDIAWVGSGSADGFFHQGIHSWDMAAGALIVKEAGGTVMSPKGGEFDLMSRGIIVASSRTLAEQIKGFIKIYSTPRDQNTPCYPF